MSEFKKGDEIFYLDYEIIYCTNNDGIILRKPKSYAGYEIHLGNYGTLDNAKVAAVVHFMLARPEVFSHSLRNKILKGSRSGTQHEYSLFVDACKAAGVPVPDEVTAGDSLNRMIYFNDKPLQWQGSEEYVGIIPHLNAEEKTSVRGDLKFMDDGTIQFIPSKDGDLRVINLPTITKTIIDEYRKDEDDEG